MNNDSLIMIHFNEFIGVQNLDTACVTQVTQTLSLEGTAKYDD